MSIPVSDAPSHDEEQNTDLNVEVASVTILRMKINKFVPRLSETPGKDAEPARMIEGSKCQNLHSEEQKTVQRRISTRVST